MGWLPNHTASFSIPVDSRHLYNTDVLLLYDMKNVNATKFQRTDLKHLPTQKTEVSHVVV
jgi:hypothetical protein